MVKNFRSPGRKLLQIYNRQEKFSRGIVGLKYLPADNEFKKSRLTGGFYVFMTMTRWLPESYRARKSRWFHLVDAGMSVFMVGSDGKLPESVAMNSA
jgi:hypothetical protein